MSIVYLASDLKHHRKVAIKVLKPEFTRALGAERFLREIQIAAGLQHPNILAVHDSGEADAVLYYVMPYVEGESLRQRLDREGQLSIEDTLRLSHQLAEALAYAHGHDIVHRDIKPENILITGDHVLIADFGIARAITVAAGERITETGLAVGTAWYMSPEQAAGDPRVDQRSDIYALGCVIYEMLAGQPPFTGRSAQAVLARHTLDPVPPLRTLRSTVPAPLERALLKALEKNPADRFRTATQFSNALEHAGPARRSENGSKTRLLLRRGLLPALLTVISLVGTAWWIWATPSVVIDSLAVLPLRNISGDSAQVYFVDAMHGAIIAELGRVAALRTISQWSALRYRNTDKSIPEIARELGVDALVEADVVTNRQNVRIQVQLVQAVPRGVSCGPTLTKGT